MALWSCATLALGQSISTNPTVSANPHMKLLLSWGPMLFADTQPAMGPHSGMREHEQTRCRVRCLCLTLQPPPPPVVLQEWTKNISQALSAEGSKLDQQLNAMGRSMGEAVGELSSGLAGGQLCCSGGGSSGVDLHPGSSQCLGRPAKAVTSDIDAAVAPAALCPQSAALRAATSLAWHTATGHGPASSIASSASPHRSEHLMV